MAKTTICGLRLTCGRTLRFHCRALIGLGHEKQCQIADNARITIVS